MEEPKYVKGYFNYSDGPRYVDPIASNEEFPQLVELHESKHAVLARLNMIDRFAKSVDSLLSDDQLAEHHRTTIETLLKAVVTETTVVHEAFATYVSLCLFARKNAAGAEKAKTQLEPRYRDALDACERAWGAINDQRITVDTLTVALACAIAAMNVELPNASIRLDKLSDCGHYLHTHSPNERFRTILGVVKPLWDRACIFRDIAAGTLTIRTVARRLREALPDLEILDLDQGNRRGDEWRAMLASSSPVTESPEPRPTSIESPADDAGLLDWYRAQLHMPGLAPEAPRDYTLAMQYLRKDLASLEESSGAFVNGPSVLLIHAILLAEPSEESEVKCFWCSSGPEEAPSVKPGVAYCSFDDLKGTLARMRGKLAIKIDQRAGIEKARGLASTGHPVFVLAHDTSPMNAVGTVREALKSQSVACAVMSLSGLGFRYGVLFARFEVDAIWFLSPVTQLGLNSLERFLTDEPRLTFLVGDGWNAFHGGDVLRHVIATAFDYTVAGR